MKKLKAEEKKEQENPGRNTSNQYEVISSRSFFAEIDLRNPDCENSYTFLYTRFFPEGINAPIFHPPALVDQML